MISQETDDLILVNIDNGSVSTSSSETLDAPQIPPAARDLFAQRCPPHPVPSGHIAAAV